MFRCDVSGLENAEHRILDQLCDTMSIFIALLDSKCKTGNKIHHLFVSTFTNLVSIKLK